MAPPVRVPDSLLFHPTSSKPRSADIPPWFIFFITGNPGLIGYYEPFLTTLSALLADDGSGRSISFHILGASLAGFEVSSVGRQAHHHAPPPPHGLLRQIELAEERLCHFVSPAAGDGCPTRRSRALPKVLLIGHSVGAYILLEIIRRHHHQTDTTSPCRGRLSIRGGILLFPTVTHLLRSPSGLRFGKVLQSPSFASVVGRVVRVVVALVPEFVLLWLVRLLTAFPDHAAWSTVGWLQSAGGVTEALSMARDEMSMITEDRWGDEVWGAASPEDDVVVGAAAAAAGSTMSGRADDDHEDSGARESRVCPNLVLYFGEDDHWVAGHARDELIATRARAESRTQMLIDRGGIPHGFCIEHSETMAEKVKGWIEDMVESDERESERG
ncbi:MAG: hypothetical protein M1826_007619 [Phylliscum demangeonii]|nr:MAG: hypothetical protein M1826_007619 [Phylliscum demangeonii]